MDMYGFYTGKILNAYEYLGCHLEGNGAVFRTFAPAAEKISVIGEFNNWTEAKMKKIYDGNFWECTIDGVRPGMMYKYRIYRKDGLFVDHCDPYGFGMELRPMSASIVRDMSTFEFRDKKWMKKRTDCRDKPLNIYEVHLGSWKNNNDHENGWYSYDKLADLLIPYIKEKGYNYIEIMPISEHPCDNSWGYQSTGFYSPTSRYGTANDLKRFVNLCHANEIGVILDFVPVHFAVDGYALAEYDGTALYEYPHMDVGYSQWGSKNFNHSRGEVQSFLQSCANYWLKEYHFDGLRIDALSNIIYWHGNKDRGINENAVEFIRYMNSSLKKLYPGVMLIAEDSTTYPNVTKAVESGGLGFDYKWDMGWMNDTLEYFKLNPCDRKAAYNKLTFSMMYYYSEQFLIPFSHDEVVHGKATIVQKMNGQYETKFPQVKALYMYMYAHPGKKLNFMGNEIGQLREWDEKREIDWDILKYPIHDSFAKFIKDLNMLYLNNPALYENDFDKSGFEWLDCNQEEKCIYAFERKSKSERMVAVFNFSDEKQQYRLPVNKCKSVQIILFSEEEQYGGKEKCDKEKKYLAKKGKVELDLPAFSGIFFKIIN